MTIFADDATVLEAIQSQAEGATEQKRLLDCASALSHRWGALTALQVRTLLSALIGRIDEFANRVDIHLLPSRVAEVLLEEPGNLSPASTCTETTDRLTLSVPAKLKRAGMGTRMIIGARNRNEPKTKPYLHLVKLIIKAQLLNKKVFTSGGASLAALAKREGLTGSYVTRLLRLSFISPDITRAILDGHHPPDLTAAKLTRLSRLPLDWNEQKRALGFS